MSKPEIDKVTVRRAPKIPTFLILGGAIGAIVTLALTNLYPVDPLVGFGPTFAYFCLFGIPAGVVLGASVALILDRISMKRAKTVDAEVSSSE